MTSWSRPASELDAWEDSGLKARLWWRDDDAYQPTRRLDRLLKVSGRDDAPLSVVVFPGLLKAGLVETLGGFPVTVIQHGCEHRNHASVGQQKCELEARRRC